MSPVMPSDMRYSLPGSQQANGDLPKRIGTFPFMDLPSELRIMIWQAAMPDSACHFHLRIQREPSGRTCALRATEATVHHRKFTAVLSATCREARHEVILKYPDLLPLCKKWNMRFSYASDTVSIGELMQRTGKLPVLPNMYWIWKRFACGLPFSRGWNAQIQNIAFKDGVAMKCAWDVGGFEEPIHYAEAAQYRLAFLSFFPRLKHHSLHYSALYEWGQFSCWAPRHGSRRLKSRQIYRKQDSTSLEENAIIACGVYDLSYGLEFYPPGSFSHEKVSSLLSHQETYKTALDAALERIVERSPRLNNETRASVLRLQANNPTYSAMISFEG